VGVNLGRLAGVWLVSAVVGTLLDRIHTYFGVLRYAHPCFCEESCWTPVVMGGAGVALVLTHGLLRRVFHQPAAGTTRVVVVQGFDFATAYLASGIFQATPLGLLTAYGVVAVFRVVQDRRPARIATVVATMIVGVTAELLLTHIGFFEYVHPDVYGVTYWIGGLYWFAGFIGSSVENRWPVLSLGAPLDS
jgi:hypothetical protein